MEIHTRKEPSIRQRREKETERKHTCVCADTQACTNTLMQLTDEIP